MNEIGQYDSAEGKMNTDFAKMNIFWGENLFKKELRFLHC